MPKGKISMKKILLIIFILSLSLTGKSQFYMSLGVGYGNTALCNLSAGVRVLKHSMFAQQVANVSTRSDLPIAEWSVNYGYLVGNSWQPYVGYSTRGVSVGLNKYFGRAAFVGAGVNGKYPYIVIGMSMFKRREYGFGYNKSN